MVAHAASNAAQARRRVVPLDEAGHAERSASGARPEPAQGDRLGRQRLAALLAEATARLDAPDRLLLLLYYDQGLTLEDMGPLMRRSKAALSRRLKRITAALKTELETSSRQRFGAPARELAGDLTSLEIDLASLLATQQRDVPAVQGKGEGA